jgi:hypothetical protein
MVKEITIPSTKANLCSEFISQNLGRNYKILLYVRQNNPKFMPNDGKKTELEVFYYRFLAVDAQKTTSMLPIYDGMPETIYMMLFCVGAPK